ncbi:MAG: radical SAM protein [Syntrophorhabdaceae bacterium]
MAQKRREKDSHSFTDYLAEEKGTVRKKWGGKIPVAIVFPNSYHVGMSNLAVHMLYKTFNDREDIVCERFFYEEGRPFVSLENSRPLSEFTLVFFTLSFELDYPNIIRTLEGSSIPAYAKDRSAGDPLVIAGGICVIANPEPVSPFFDLMILGDIEATIPPFMDRFREMHDLSRDDLIAELAFFSFVYNPVFVAVDYHENGQVRSFVPGDFSIKVEFHQDKCLGKSVITSPNTEFGSMVLIEGTRGCPSRCSFCLLGNLYHFRSEIIDALPEDTRDVGIVGGGISFHPRIVEIVKNLRSRGVGVHLPSLRLDEVPLSLIELIKDDIKTLTFGIEAASEPLRGLLGKPINDDEILSRIDSIMTMKSFNLKLYFMIGLPGETLDDIDAIPDLVKKIRHLMIKHGSLRGSLGNITIHASPFVPKAATPFQWLPMADMNDLKDKVSRLRHAFKKIDNTFFTHDSVKFSFLQAVLSRGDRRAADIVVRLAHGETLSNILRESPVNLNFYALRQRSKNEIFPWDFIRGIISKDKLFQMLQSREEHVTRA